MKIDSSRRGELLFRGLVLSTGLCAAVLLLRSRGDLAALHHASGFYFVFVTFFLWLFLQLPRRLEMATLKEQAREQWPVLLLILAVTAAMFHASPPQFRILADETNLLGAAASMYDEHSFRNVTSGLYYYHGFHELEHVWGTRPIFYPFLIYLVHSVYGYSAYNGFVVNAVAGALSLWCLYWLLLRWFPRPLAIAGMLSLAAYPVFVMWVTASGFEIVNLLLSLTAFYWLARFLESEDTYDLERLVLTLVLLAQARYESVVFAFGTLLAVVLFMRRRHYQQLSYRAIGWPLLFLPVALQRVLKSDRSQYQIDENESMFGVEHFVSHAQSAWQYFAATDSRYGTISLIFFLALIGLGVAVVRLWPRRGGLSPEVRGVAIAGAVSYSLLGAVVLSYYWGDLTSPVAMRFGIIFLPLLIVLALICVDVVVRSSEVGSRAVLLGSVALIFFYWPVAGRNESVTMLTLNRQYRTTLQYLTSNHPGRNVLIIAERPGMYAVHRWGATGFDYANQNARRITKDLKRRLYQDILVLQRINYSNGKPEPSNRLDARYQLEVLFESQYMAASKLRISRVVLGPLRE